MFGKNLTDLVRGIRANKKNEAKFINTQIQAIKEEVRQSDPMKKAIGIQKLTYLQMMGYDMSWAAFNVVEVMSSEKFAQKRLGYLAASQSFQEDTDVILLTTALIKRDMTSPDMYTAGVALNCLANIVTPDLAQDLAQDILAMLNSSRPYVRKKSVLVLYKIFLKFPGALRVSFPRLKDKLTDDDTSVVSAAVNVICELARLNPEKYLILAPILFKLLTVTSNNWMLIKIVKLMGALTPHEPRLAKKLVDPLSNLINSTPAMSLLYECINTCTIGLYEHIPIIKLCIAKLRLFVQDPDQNLKYLGLCALYNIMQRHPKAVTEHRDLILNCLDDPDITIRLRALDLVEGMVKKKTLQEIVRRLMDQVLAADGGSYREDLIAKIVSICSQGNYQFVRDFEWYISTLVEMTRVRGTQHGVLIASQLLDVAIRVRVVRPFAVVNMVNLILDPRFLTEAPGDNSVAEVLYAAAWVVGEFGAGVLAVDQILRVVEAMVQPRVSALPPHIQAVYIHNTLKLFNMVAQTGANIGAGGSGVAAPTADLLGDAAGSPAPVTEAEINTRLRDLIAIIKDRLPKFMSSDHLEVQERACSVLNLVAAVEGLLLQGEYGVVAELATAFEEAMNPVKAGSQRRVPVPDGLDLDAWINDPPPEPEPEPVAGEYEFNFGADDSDDDDDDDEWGREQRISDARVARQKNDYILVDSLTQEAFDVDSIPFEELHLEGEEIVVGKSGRRRRRRHGDGGNNPGGIRIARPARNVEYVVDTTEEGFEDDLVDNAEDAPISTREQLARALDVDLEEPIGAQDMLPVRTHHVVRHDATPAAAAAASTANADAAPAASGGRRRRRRRGGNNASAPAAAAPAVSAQPPAAATRPTGLLTSHGGTPPATQAAEAVVDTFEDDLPELAPTSTAAAATPSPAPAPAAAANGTAAAAPSGGKRRRRRRGGNKPSEGNATGDLLGGQAATSTAASTSTSTAAGGASLEDIMGGGSGGGSGADADIFTEEMCADGNMAFRYYVAPTGDANSVSVVISCANLASTMVTGLEFAVVDSMNMKCTTTDPSTGSVKAGMQLFPGVSDTYTLVFSFKDYAGRQRLRGSVTYTLSTGGDQSTGASLDFALMFPPSVFILPVAVDQAEFAEICGSGEMSNAPKVRFDGPEGMSFPDVAGLIVAKLNLVVIHAIEGAASCYGQSVRGEHLALLVKAAEGGKFVAEVKCSNERLGDAISEQIRELFA